jgi:hypothetical protein
MTRFFPAWCSRPVAHWFRTSLPGMAAVLAIFGWVPNALADRSDDVARIHLEALGGKERVAALAAMHATGAVVSRAGRVRFTMVAARPNRLRLETGSGNRTLVQATDGVNPSWEFDTGKWPPRYQNMPENIGRTFATDAEFDDPLVGGKERGYTFEYSGETTVENRRLLRIQVSRPPGETFAVLIDEDTYLITMRVEKRAGGGGKSLQIQTRYDDYRPVEGVLLPHRITVVVDGEITQQTLIDDIDPNPPLTAETFARPKPTPAARE